MRTSVRRSDERERRWVNWLGIAVAVAVILTEFASAYILFRSLGVSDPVVYGGTAAAAVIIGGSSLYVGGRQRFRADSPTESREKSDFVRVSELVVSVTVLTAVTVFLGSLGGLSLTVLAMVGGPDPKTDDGDLLRHRLIEWPQKNRAFMRNNGTGTLPLKP